MTMQNYYNSDNTSYESAIAPEEALVCAFFTFDHAIADRYCKHLKNIGIPAHPGEASSSSDRTTSKNLNIPILVPESQYERAAEIIATFEATDDGGDEWDDDEDEDDLLDDDEDDDDDDDFEPDDDIVDDDDEDDEDDKQDDIF